MFRSWFTDCNEWRCFSKTINVRNLPAKFILYRSIVAAAGGAPAVKIRNPCGALARNFSGAFAIAIKTVGAAQNIVTFSFLIAAKTKSGLHFSNKHEFHHLL